MSDEFEDRDTYLAVVNDEDQYSIWPANREVPSGWREAGKQGTRTEVLAWIQEVWSDMNPEAARSRLDRSGGADGEGHPS